jgi:hypothetical protein
VIQSTPTIILNRGLQMRELIEENDKLRDENKQLISERDAYIKIVVAITKTNYTILKRADEERQLLERQILSDIEVDHQVRLLISGII